MERVGVKIDEPNAHTLEKIVPMLTTKTVFIPEHLVRRPLKIRPPVLPSTQEEKKTAPKLKTGECTLDR